MSFSGQKKFAVALLVVLPVAAATHYGESLSSRISFVNIHKWDIFAWIYSDVLDNYHRTDIKA